MTRPDMLAIIMAYDLSAVERDMREGDLGYMVSILTGGGWTQYESMSDDDVREEYRVGEYASLAKQAAIRDSPLMANRFYKDLVSKYDRALRNVVDDGDPLEDSDA
jgi:hypothetical protein